MPFGRFSLLSATLAVVVVALVVVRPSHADHILISFTRAPAFSGNLKDCADQPNNTACIWGLPAALAKHRLLVNTANATSHVFIPDMDIQSSFIHIHPEKAGLNIKLFKAFNISHYRTDPWFLPDLGNNIPLQPFLTSSVTPLMSTRDVSNTHELHPFVSRYMLLHNGRIAVLDAGYSKSSFVTNLIPKLKVIIKYLRYLRVEIIVLLCEDRLRSADWYVTNLLDDYAVDVVVDLQADTNTPCTPTTLAVHNTTKGVVCRATSDTTLVASLLVDTHVGTPISNTKLFVDSAASLHANETDDLYLQHRDIVQNELLTAIYEDEVIGFTTDVVLGGRFPGTSNEFPCFTGECALGTLLARSYLSYYPQADISLFSAGACGGDSWPAGNITSSQVWNAFPYGIAYCVGRIMGLKLFQVVDAALGASTFLPTATGYHLLHLGNAIIEINPNLPTHRLISLKIRNNVTGVYEPLDRLRYYNFVSNNFQCDINSVTASLFNTLLDGESKTTLEGTLSQLGVKAYLTAHSPYNDLTTGYMRFVDSTVPIVWSTEEVACGRSEYWSVGVKSCVLCAEGTCVDESSSDSHHLDLIWQIGTPVLAVVLICVAVVCILEWRRRSGARVTTNAPRGGSDVVIVFTDIQASTKLWGTSPASMAAALGKHNAVIRKEIARHNGYEVKTVGDSFMIALSSAQDAVDMAAAIQTALHRQSWPRAIDNVYNATTDELLAAVEDDVDGEWIPELPLPSGDNNNNSGADSSQPAAAFRGIRIRIGAHYGSAEVEFDTVAKGYDYHGPTVNVAARVEAAGRGGQILVTQSLTSKLSKGSRNFKYTIAPHGAVELRGVSGTTELSEVVVSALPPRDYTVSVLSPTDTNTDTSKSYSVALLGFSAHSMGAPVSTSTMSKSPEQELAYKCLDVYMSVVPRLDRELMLRTLGRAWGLEEKTTSFEKSTLELLAVRAGHRLRRVLDKSFAKNVDRDEFSVQYSMNVSEIRTTLPNHLSISSNAITGRPSVTQELLLSMYTNPTSLMKVGGPPVVEGGDGDASGSAHAPAGLVQLTAPEIVGLPDEQSTDTKKKRRMSETEDKRKFDSILTTTNIDHADNTRCFNPSFCESDAFDNSLPSGGRRLEGVVLDSPAEPHSPQIITTSSLVIPSSSSFYANPSMSSIDEVVSSTNKRNKLTSSKRRSTYTSIPTSNENK
eukprot:TRINITY_DN2215_c0_g1_i5.p1 TRINITY_DN2215_c0_g1~~TRINITY_DN2215_c0_g1_i5.p1  ORF type:complete len:1190 (+),score=174.14 TRINITY_DN2215_c0_g1_i5:57-3626(+)